LTIHYAETKDHKIDDKTTIKVEEYTFKIPNFEVTYGFAYTVFRSAYDTNNKFFCIFYEKLPAFLLKKDAEETAIQLHNLLSAIASEQHEPSEKHSNAVILVAFIATGMMPLVRCKVQKASRT
jgi:hypothetical protein